MNIPDSFILLGAITITLFAWELTRDARTWKKARKEQARRDLYELAGRH